MESTTEVVEPNKPEDHSYEQQISILSYMMFLKLKSDEVTIKRRGCACRRKHQYWLSKEYTSPATVNTEGIMLSCMIDAMGLRDTATATIP